MITLNALGGKPACSARYANARVVRGVSGDGLAIIIQPAARAAPTFPRIILTYQHTHCNQIQRKYSRDGKVPRNKSHTNTNGLLDNHHPTIRRSRCANLPADTLRLGSKPLSKAGGIVDLAVCLVQRLSGLMCQYGGDIVAVVAKSWCHRRSSWARVLGFKVLYVWKASWEDWMMGSTSSAARSRQFVNSFPVPGSVDVNFLVCFAEGIVGRDFVD